MIITAENMAICETSCTSLSLSLSLSILQVVISPELSGLTYIILSQGAGHPAQDEKR